MPTAAELQLQRLTNRQGREQAAISRAATSNQVSVIGRTAEGIVGETPLGGRIVLSAAGVTPDEGEAYPIIASSPSGTGTVPTAPAVPTLESLVQTGINYRLDVRDPTTDEADFGTIELPLWINGLTGTGYIWDHRIARWLLFAPGHIEELHGLIESPQTKQYTLMHAVTYRSQVIGLTGSAGVAATLSVADGNIIEMGTSLVLTISSVTATEYAFTVATRRV